MCNNIYNNSVLHKYKKLFAWFRYTTWNIFVFVLLFSLMFFLCFVHGMAFDILTSLKSNFIHYSYKLLATFMYLLVQMCLSRYIPNSYYFY